MEYQNHLIGVFFKIDLGIKNPRISRGFFNSGYGLDPFNNGRNALTQTNTHRRQTNMCILLFHHV